MDDNQVWQAIDEERLRLAEVLDQLTEKEWRHRSLCGWLDGTRRGRALDLAGAWPLCGDRNFDPGPNYAA